MESSKKKNKIIIVGVLEMAVKYCGGKGVFWRQEIGIFLFLEIGDYNFYCWRSGDGGIVGDWRLAFLIVGDRRLQILNLGDQKKYAQLFLSSRI